MAFLAAENENLQMKDFTRADFSYVAEISLKVAKKSITDNFVYWKLRPQLFCNDSGLFFILSFDVNAIYYFCSGIIDPFVFIC